MKTLRTIQSILILFLLFTGFSLQCGPGNRSGGRRQKSRKMTPLVYKEHVPNISENTLGASGLPDGAITRGDARFKDLVENHNTDIIFRDEERDGSDRLMSEVRDSFLFSNVLIGYSEFALPGQEKITLSSSIVNIGSMNL